MTKRVRALDARRQANSTNPEISPNLLATQLRVAVRIARTTGPMLRRRPARAVAATSAGAGWTNPLHPDEHVAASEA